MSRDELLALADELIQDLLQHEGAEGFSQSTWRLYEKYQEVRALAAEQDKMT